MIKHLKLIFFLILVFACGIVDSENEEILSDKIFVAMQALDKVAIIDYASGIIDTTIQINFDTISCMSIQGETACDVAPGCFWHEMGSMSHCMNIDADDGPPLCLLDCEGIENIDPDEDMGSFCNFIETSEFEDCSNDCSDDDMSSVDGLIYFGCNFGFPWSIA